MKGTAAPFTASILSMQMLTCTGVGLQARQLMRGLCYRTIAEVRLRQQSRQQGSQLQQQQQQQGAQSSPVNGAASPAFSSDDDAVSPAGGGSRKQRRKGTLPFGGFIGHLLESDNPIVDRQFTDLEVGLTG